jgi:hypothetical protein
MHADGIFLFAANSGSTLVGTIYNNRVITDMCNNTYQNCTAPIFVQGVHNTYIFNNLVSTLADTIRNPESDIRLGQTETNIYLINNTEEGDYCVKYDTTTNIVWENNICAQTSTSGLLAAQDSNFNSIGTSNYNDYYALSHIAVNQTPAYFNTLAAWQATTISGSVNPDTSGSAGNPNYSGTYFLQAGSAAIGLATNLHSTCSGQPVPGLGALCNDAAGNVRPSSGNWDAGIYNYQNTPAPYSGGQIVGQVLPPTDLRATVE